LKEHLVPESGEENDLSWFSVIYTNLSCWIKLIQEERCLPNAVNESYCCLRKIEIDILETEKVILKRNLLGEDVKEKQEVGQLFKASIFKEPELKLCGI
jgi:hypothetical protein